MNIYRHVFIGPCPNNDRTIEYHLEVRACSTIMVEEIVAACKATLDAEKPYHENIADALFARFGGEQTLRAHHHGVDIETVRP